MQRIVIALNSHDAIDVWRLILEKLAHQNKLHTT